MTVSLATPVPSAATAAADQAHPGIPSLKFANTRVEPSAHVQPGSAMALTLATIMVIISTLFLTLVTYGIALIGVIVSAALSYGTQRKAMAIIRGSGIRCSPRQFPAIHSCAVNFAQRCGLTDEPEVYIVESSVLNAFVVKLGRKNVVLLTDNVVEACIRNQDSESLGFIIGHEIAHIAHGHLGTFRQAATKVSKRLGRLDEYSADLLADALIGSRNGAIRGLLLLTVGPALVRHLDADEVKAQIEEVRRDRFTNKAEKKLTHPLPLNRIANLLRAR